LGEGWRRRPMESWEASDVEVTAMEEEEEEEESVLLLELGSRGRWGLDQLFVFGGWSVCEWVSVRECDPFYSSGRLHSKFLWRSQVKYWISFIIKIKYE
jgi:hypothetical protein